MQTDTQTVKKTRYINLMSDAEIKAMQADEEWKRHIERGKEALSKKQDAQWSIGDEAVAICQKWKREDEEKRNRTLAAYAYEIGLESDSGGVNRIYDYYDVSEFWGQDKSAHARIKKTCRNASWSMFRAAARQARKEGKAVADAEQWMYQSNDEEMNVSEFTAWLKDGRPGHVTKRKYIQPDKTEINLAEKTITYHLTDTDVKKLYEWRDNLNFRTDVRVIWEQENLPKQ